MADDRKAECHARERRSRRQSSAPGIRQTRPLAVRVDWPADLAGKELAVMLRYTATTGYYLPAPASLDLSTISAPLLDRPNPDGPAEGQGRALI